MELLFNKTHKNSSKAISEEEVQKLMELLLTASA
jgi:hypothetical protein